MSIELPRRDPSGAYRRKVTAARRQGKKKCHKCGEARPEALIPKSHPVICAKCKRESLGHSTTDNHHFAGQANHPATVPIPVNDHRADLNTAQLDWQEKTRKNPDGCPLLAAAGCIRGFVDTVIYLIKKGVLWIAEMLESAHDWLVEQFGPKWWVGTPLEQFAPKGSK